MKHYDTHTYSTNVPACMKLNTQYKGDTSGREDEASLRSAAALCPREHELAENFPHDPERNKWLQTAPTYVPHTERKELNLRCRLKSSNPLKRKSCDDCNFGSGHSFEELLGNSLSHFLSHLLLLFLNVF